MMFQNGYYNLAIIEEPEIQVLELPYGKKGEGELSMFIFLPKDIKDNSTGLEQVNPLISEGVYKRLIYAAYECTDIFAHLQLPGQYRQKKRQ